MVNPYEAPGVDPDEATTQHGLIERGRMLVIAISIAELATNAFNLYTMPTLQRMLSNAIYAALLYFLYRGKTWARLALIVLFALGVTASLWLFGRPLLETPNIWFIAVLLSNVASAIVLARSSSVALFQRHQRQPPPLENEDDDEDDADADA